MDERMQLPEMKSDLPGRLDIDLQDLESMNSTGCRNWVHWIRAIKAKGIYLHNCPPQFVSQAAILKGVIPDGVTVQSFYIPYYCDSCGASETVRMELGKDFRDYESLVIRDQIICPVCSSIMRLDIVKERYVSFLAKKPA